MLQLKTQRIKAERTAFFRAMQPILHFAAGFFGCLLNQPATGILLSSCYLQFYVGTADCTWGCII